MYLSVSSFAELDVNLQKTKEIKKMYTEVSTEKGGSFFTIVCRASQQATDLNGAVSK
jgi:hypothetical protein